MSRWEWYYEKGLAGWKLTSVDTSAAQYITVFEIMSNLLFICTLECFKLKFLHTASLTRVVPSPLVGLSVVSCAGSLSLVLFPVFLTHLLWFSGLSSVFVLSFSFFCWQFLLPVFWALALLDFIYLSAFVSGVWVLFCVDCDTSADWGEGFFCVWPTTRKKYPHKYPAVSHFQMLKCRLICGHQPGSLHVHLCPLHLLIWGGNRDELWTYDTFCTNVN